MTSLPSDAIRVVATVPISPSAAAQAAPSLTELAAASLQEEGCLAYDVFESNAAGTFVTIEVWRGEDDLTAHMSTPHVATAFEVLGPLLAGDVAIHTLKPV